MNITGILHVTAPDRHQHELAEAVVISILIIGFAILLSSGAAILVVYSKSGAQESLGGVILLVSMIILTIGFLSRVYGV